MLTGGRRSSEIQDSNRATGTSWLESIPDEFECMEQRTDMQIILAKAKRRKVAYTETIV